MENDLSDKDKKSNVITKSGNITSLYFYFRLMLSMSIIASFCTISCFAVSVFMKRKKIRMAYYKHFKKQYKNSNENVYRGSNQLLKGIENLSASNLSASHSSVM